MPYFFAVYRFIITFANEEINKYKNINNNEN